MASVEISERVTVPELQPVLYFGVWGVAVTVVIFGARHIHAGFERWRAIRNAAKVVPHMYQAEARRDYPHYTQAIVRQMKLLQMTAAELAELAGIDLAEAEAIVRYPKRVVRLEILSAIETALFLPEGFFRNGRESHGSLYGEEFTKRRLVRYLNQWPRDLRLIFRQNGVDPTKPYEPRLEQFLPLVEKIIEKELERRAKQ